MTPNEKKTAEQLKMITAFSERLTDAARNGQPTSIMVQRGAYHVPDRKSGFMCHFRDGSEIMVVMIGPLPPHKHPSSPSPAGWDEPAKIEGYLLHDSEGKEFFFPVDRDQDAAIVP